eukprot:663866-Pelagomonas_calceolata.AAC.1
MQAAVAAGIPVVGLTTGQDASTLVAAGANLVVADFDALMDIIESGQEKLRKRYTRVYKGLQWWPTARDSG